MSTPPPDDWPIPEEIRKWIGFKTTLGTEQVEAGTIRKFADAYMDSNPLWYDEDYAKETPYGGVVAPPSFLHCLQTVGYPRKDLLKIPIPWENHASLNGGNEFTLYEPMRPGDSITGEAEVVEIFGRLSKQMGTLMFTVVEMTYTNQNGDLVAKQRTTGIRYETKV
jgi:acyl dehydratase